MSSLHQIDDIFTVASTTDDERALLGSLAECVPDGGLIVEIGCLYGGTTQILAKHAPGARIVSIEDFGWSPAGYPKNSAELFMENMRRVGADNVRVMHADSRKAGREWREHIDLLWIDGGHSYPYVYSDLYTFGQWADVIALHDYKNPEWLSVEKAVEVFVAKFPQWTLETVIGMVAVLRRVQ